MINSASRFWVSLTFTLGHLPPLNFFPPFSVWFTYLLELAQVCCSAVDLYFWFGAGYGNLISLNTTHLSPFDTPFIGAIVALVVQLFFCYRIWKLKKNNWYIVVCVIIGAVCVYHIGWMALGWGCIDLNPSRRCRRCRGYIRKSHYNSHIILIHLLRLT